MLLTYKYEKQALSTAIFLLGVFSVITTSAVAQLRSSPVGKSHNATTTAVKEASWQFPLHEQSGTQHVHVWIGDPPSRQTWIVDTGSRFSATACEGCRDCGVHANRYLPTTSSASSTRIPHQCSRGDAHVFDKMEETSSGFNEAAVVLGCHMADRCVRNKCEINQQYTEGSTWTAVEVNDIVALGEEHLYEATWDAAAAFSFGCQTEVKGLFRKQYADGILGLERTDRSIVDTMASQGIIERPSFSLCLRPDGGWIGLGGPQTQRHLEPIQFTNVPHASEHVWHSVMVREIWIDDMLVADEASTPSVMAAFRKGKRTILDSGTTDTFLPAALDKPMTKAWEQRTDLAWKARTRQYTYEEFMSLPPIHIVLEGNATLTLDPQHYMEGALTEAWDGKRRLTNRVYTDESVGAVLGLNAMMGYDIYYEGSRIGVAKADCN